MNYLPASKEVLNKLSKMVKSKMFDSEEKRRTGSTSEQVYKMTTASGNDEVLTKAIKKAMNTLDENLVSNFYLLLSSYLSLFVY